jgi:hypothetical protein
MLNSPTPLFEKDSSASKMIFSAKVFFKWGRENVLDYGKINCWGKHIKIHNTHRYTRLCKNVFIADVLSQTPLNIVLGDV